MRQVTRSIGLVLYLILVLAGCYESSDPLDSEFPDEELAESIRRLESIGYLEGSRPAQASGVSIFERDRTASGLNLYSSGHAPEAILMTMSGRILHRWRKKAVDIWPDLAGKTHPGAKFWRRVHLLQDGSILAIFEGLGLVKLSRDSQLLWSHPGREHHDVDVLEDGSIYVLTRKARVVPWIDESRPVLEDFVVELSPEGQPRRRISVLEALRDSGIAERISAEVFAGDVLHTNTIVVLDASAREMHPSFKPGNVLISLNTLGTLAVLDLEERRIVWYWTGTFEGGQHDPEPLGGSRVLLFHNGSSTAGSRVVELDLREVAAKTVYEKGANTAFFSKTCGTVQRLPNGNTLVTESDAGRAFEISPKGKIVWEFFNPYRVGPKNEYIATLFEMERLDDSLTEQWLERPH